MLFPAVPNDTGGQADAATLYVWLTPSPLLTLLNLYVTLIKLDSAHGRGDIGRTLIFHSLKGFQDRPLRRLKELRYIQDMLSGDDIIGNKSDQRNLKSSLFMEDKRCFRRSPAHTSPQEAWTARHYSTGDGAVRVTESVCDVGISLQ